MEHILVVEDDLALSTGLCFELDAAGYATQEAYNCRKAEYLAAQEKFSLVILDVNLPDGNGFELCKKMKSRTPELPVIFLTANDLEEDVLNGYDPTGPASLQEAIDQKKTAAVIYGIDGIALEAYGKEEHVLSGSYDAEQFATGQYVLAAGLAVGKEKEKALPAPSVGDTVSIDGMDYTVMAVLDNLNVITEGAREGGAGSSTKDQYYMEYILPLETFRKNWPENTPRKLFFNIDDAYLDTAQEMLDQYCARTGIHLPVTTRRSMAEQYEREVHSSAVMGNVVSIVIALVGVLNYVNSMITSIVSRRKEFAMMQSVGMMKRQLCKLLVYEGIDYAWITLLITYAVSSLAVGIGVRAMVEGGYTTFRFTLLPLAVCTPILILFALIVPYLCFRNLEKDSLVERLRTD